jgi:hypothetical protein
MIADDEMLIARKLRDNPSPHLEISTIGNVAKMQKQSVSRHKPSPFLDHERIGVWRALAQVLDVGVAKVIIGCYPSILDVGDHTHSIADGRFSTLIIFSNQRCYTKGMKLWHDDVRHPSYVGIEITYMDLFNDI